MNESVESTITDFCRLGQVEVGGLIEDSDVMLRIVLELVKER